MRTRFAPSPTGDLHLGGALCALASWWWVRTRAGASAGADVDADERAFVLRMEDLDPPRVVAGSSARILDDLAWLGLDWDEGPRARARAHKADADAAEERGAFGPYAQSRRGARYAAAIETLRARGLVYPCDCSRAEIARIASAPHAGEEVVYPGTCRDADPERPLKRAPALRVRVPRGESVTIVDAFAGAFTQRLDEAVGDFVLMRGDGVYAYQLAVVVDDLAMKITDVVRGVDLLASTPRQAWLARELGYDAATLPRWFHVPLVVDHQGHRLEKRTPGAHVRGLREAGTRAETIIGMLAHSLGLVADASPISPSALLDVPHEALRPSALHVPLPR